jgi:hypothetical protein
MVIPLPSDPIKIMPKRIGRSVRVYFTRLPWLRNGIYGGYVYVNIYICINIYIYHDVSWSTVGWIHCIYIIYMMMYIYIYIHRIQYTVYI